MTALSLPLSLSPPDRFINVVWNICFTILLPDTEDKARPSRLRNIILLASIRAATYPPDEDYEFFSPLLSPPTKSLERYEAYWFPGSSFATDGFDSRSNPLSPYNKVVPDITRRTRREPARSVRSELSPVTR